MYDSMGNFALRLLILFLYILICMLISTADADQQNSLTLSYSRDVGVCNAFRSLVKASDCSIDDEQCFVFDMHPVKNSPVSKVVFRELAVNQYGFTGIWVSDVALGDGRYVILYLQNFQGDRHPRLVETWKVDKGQLDALTALSPKPLPYEQWIKRDNRIAKETYAKEFASLLQDGERISDNWSPVWSPIFELKDKVYAINRECAGRWTFGGVYVCNRTIKFTVKQVFPDRTVIPVCEFVRSKSKAETR